MEGDLLWDGAVVAHTPLRLAIGEGAKEIYVIPEGRAGRRARPKGLSPAHLLDAVATPAVTAS